MRPDRRLRPQWLGRLSYPWALRLQRSRRAAVLRGHAPEAFWLLEHPAVITLGRRGGTVHPHATDPVVTVERGGLATWHGPGQLVGYLILDLPRRGIGVRVTVHALEQGIIDWLSSVGVSAERVCGVPGVWVGDAKIAQVGLHVRRGVTLHGFALNITNDLAAFDQIVPCGLDDRRVTSVAALGGPVAPLHHVAPAVGRSVVENLLPARPATQSLDHANACD